MKTIQKVRVNSILLLGALGLNLMSCAQQIQKPAPIAGDSTKVTIEVDDEITAEELRAGLRKAKFLLLNNPVLTPEEQEIKDLSVYRSKIIEYLDDEASVTAIQSYFYKMFGIEAPNATYNHLEPSNLAAKLYKDNADFRDFLTADYCVEKADENFLTGPCLSRTDDYSYVMPAEMTAGFMGTQAFLNKYAGAKNFRRIAKAFEFALCSEAPASGETEGWSESATETTLHPFYWNSLNQVEGMNCTSCHGSGGLNQGRIAFTPFDEAGVFLAGQTVVNGEDTRRVEAITLNDVEADLIGNPNGSAAQQDAYALYQVNYGAYGFDFERAFEPEFTRFFGEQLDNYNFFPEDPENPSYPSLAQMGRLMANHELFSRCMAQRMFEFAKHGKPMGISYRPPTHTHEHLTTAFKDSNFKLKNLLIEVFVNPTYLNL